MGDVNNLEKVIKIPPIDMIGFLGFNDMNIQPLEKMFLNSFTIRGENIFLNGDSKQVLLLEKIFKEMIFVFKSTDNLTPQDVETIIDLTTKGKEIITEDEFNNIILYTKHGTIKAKTPTQVELFKSVQKNDICFAIGPAGTGKTYLSVALAVAALQKGTVQRLILARPAVEAGESLGFLPGDLKEKIDPYLRPLYDSLQDMIPVEQLKNYMEKNIIEIVPLAYMRGRTLNNAYVILDEAQNCTNLQMKMFLTRLGPNSKAIITGDVTQIDLPKNSISGLVEIQKILRSIEGVDFIKFAKRDVVRHKLVRDIIEAYEDYQNGDNK